MKWVLLFTAIPYTIQAIISLYQRDWGLAMTCLCWGMGNAAFVFAVR